MSLSDRFPTVSHRFPETVDISESTVSRFPPLKGDTDTVKVSMPPELCSRPTVSQTPGAVP